MVNVQLNNPLSTNLLKLKMQNKLPKQNLNIDSPQASSVAPQVKEEKKTVVGEKSASDVVIENVNKNSNVKNIKKEDYKDPLENWPLRGLAYSNEIGAAIGEVAPTLGTLLWVPALMYFGADIYDKYKNHDKNYDPSKQRGLEQATFQACASVVLPTAAVHMGQHVASALGKKGASGLSLNARMNGIKYVSDFMEQNKLYKYADNPQEFKDLLKASYTTQNSGKTSRQVNAGPVKKLFNETVSFVKKKLTIGQSKTEKMLKFIDDQADELFAFRKQLMNSDKPKGMARSAISKWAKSIPNFKEKFGEAEYMAHAAKEGLRENMKSKIFKLKMLKTVGGFVALGLMIKPIDNFVEKVVMKRFVQPGLDNLAMKFEMKDRENKTPILDNVKKSNSQNA